MTDKTLEEYLAEKRQEITDLETEPSAKEIRKQKLLEQLENRDLKPTEVAAMLGVHVNTVKRMLSRSELKGAYRIGSRGDWRIPRASVIEFKDRGGVNVF